MEIKRWPTLVLSTAFMSSLAYGNSEQYVVQKGDTFTHIIEKLSRVNDQMSYNQMIALMLKLNEREKLSDFDKLKIGQVLKVPSFQKQSEYLSYYEQKYPYYWNPSLWRTSRDPNYTVKAGDTLSTIAQSHIPELSLFGKHGSLALMLKINDQIKTADKIFVGQEINLPTKTEILAFQLKQKKKRLPAEVLSPKKEKKDKVQDDVKVIEGKTQTYFYEIPNINLVCKENVQKKCFALLNKELLSSKERVQTMSCLKNLLDYSRQCQASDLESFFLKTISIFINPKNETEFINLLRSYFLENLKA